MGALRCSCMKLECVEHSANDGMLTTTTGVGQSTKINAAATTAAQLTSLMTHDAATSQEKSMDDTWHAAEGHHLWLLAQRRCVYVVMLLPLP